MVAESGKYRAAVLIDNLFGNFTDKLNAKPRDESNWIFYNSLQELVEDGWIVD
jgi:hypothetical protein